MKLSSLGGELLNSLCNSVPKIWMRGIRGSTTEGCGWLLKIIFCVLVTDIIIERYILEFAICCATIFELVCT